jgi:hypothetical protein
VDEGDRNGNYAWLCIFPHLILCLTCFANKVCTDAQLICNVWARYDAEESGSEVFTSLINRLVTEKPALLVVGSQMSGVGVSSHPGDSPVSSGSNFDVGAVAGMVATAASATVSGDVGMMGSGGGLSLQESAWVYITELLPSLFLIASSSVLTNLTRPTRHPFRSHTSTSLGYNASYLSAKASRHSPALYTALL